MEYDTIKLLNLEDIDIDLSKSYIVKNDNVITCNITLNKTSYCCEYCGSVNTIIHGYSNKKITHSISTGYHCVINYKARRFKCKDCNSTFFEKNPFCMKDEKLSLYTDMKILEKLKSHTATFSSVSRDLNVSIQTVINTFDKYINPQRLKLPKILSIDEIYTNKLTSKKYSCILMDFETKQIIEIYPSRLKFDLFNYIMQIPLRERECVKYTIIDMWDTYKQVSNAVFPNSIVAVDSFHVMKHLNAAIDLIRLKVMKRFDKGHSKLLNADMYYYMLKKFHYFFTRNYDNIYDGDIKIQKLKTSWKKDEILKYLLYIDKDLEYAYYLKSRYQEFNMCAKYETCDEELEYFINEFSSSHLEEYRVFGRLLNHWRKEIKNSFIRIKINDPNTKYIITRRLSNGPIEGLNSRIKCIIKNANGYRNFQRFRKRIFYSINKNTPITNYNK